MNSQDKQDGEWHPQESESIASVTGGKVGVNMMTEAKGREEVVMVNAITQLCREGLRSFNQQPVHDLIESNFRNEGGMGRTRLKRNARRSENIEVSSTSVVVWK